MNRSTAEHRVYIDRTYFENGSSVINTLCKIRDYFGVQDHPSEIIFHNIVCKFKTTVKVSKHQHLYVELIRMIMLKLPVKLSNVHVTGAALLTIMPY